MSEAATEPVESKKTKSFVTEYPLQVGPEEEAVLLSRFEVARCLYNSALGESLNRLQRMRESKAWQAARKLKSKEARSAAFHALTVEYGFTAALSTYATETRHDAHWEDRIGGPEAQKVVERAFRAAQRYSFRKGGRPRFKSKRRPIHSVEGKSNKAAILWKPGTGSVTWMKLALMAILPDLSRDPRAAEAAGRRVKYCRITWRMAKGKRRWYLQVVREGVSPWAASRTTAPGKKVALDVGPTMIAVLAEDLVAYVPLCPKVVQPWAEIRRIQQAMDRSRRATNPHLYNRDGIPKTGSRQTVFSQNYRDLRAELAERQRRLRAERLRSHRELANKLVSHGNRIPAEKLSYRAFQKNFGRSTQVRGLGLFMSILSSKAESAGGGMTALKTRVLRLSQYDHPTGTYTRKPLNQRIHVLGDGSGEVQRDIYSAFLAGCVNAKGDQLCHPATVARRWRAAEPLLISSGWYKPQPQADGGGGVAPAPSPHGLAPAGAAVDEGSPTPDA